MCEIDVSLLKNPEVEGSKDSDAGVYVGRGSFGIVRIQTFRGINVAVKEFLPHTQAGDVKHEALMLSCLCHPHLPFLFGIHTLSRPYKIVTQFHSLFDSLSSVTLKTAISNSLFKESSAWLTLSGQIFEALRYLHVEVKLIHNDLKEDNILVTQSFCDGNSMVQIVIIDFGKATKICDGKRFTLSDTEKSEYMRMYPYMAPELIDGLAKESPQTDIYSAGSILLSMHDHRCLQSLAPDINSAYLSISTKCKSVHAHLRPSAQKVFTTLQSLATH